jgi:hypothetical protein
MEGYIPDAVAAGGLALAHGDAGLAGAHLAGELIDGLEQGLPSQCGGSACGSGSHGYGVEEVSGTMLQKEDWGTWDGLGREGEML